MNDDHDDDLDYCISRIVNEIKNEGKAAKQEFTYYKKNIDKDVASECASETLMKFSLN